MKDNTTAQKTMRQNAFLDAAGPCADRWPLLRFTLVGITMSLRIPLLVPSYYSSSFPSAREQTRFLIASEIALFHLVWVVESVSPRVRLGDASIVSKMPPLIC